MNQYKFLTTFLFNTHGKVRDKTPLLHWLVVCRLSSDQRKSEWKARVISTHYNGREAGCCRPKTTIKWFDTWILQSITYVWVRLRNTLPGWNMTNCPLNRASVLKLTTSRPSSLILILVGYMAPTEVLLHNEQIQWHLYSFGEQNINHYML